MLSGLHLNNVVQRGSNRLIFFKHIILNYSKIRYQSNEYVTRNVKTKKSQNAENTYKIRVSLRGHLKFEFHLYNLVL